MQFRIAYPLILLFALLALVAAAPNPDADNKPTKPKPSATPTQPPKPPPASSCSKELVCCLQSTSSSDFSAGLIIDLLHIPLTSEQKKEPVGLTCTSLPKGFGKSCSLKLLCCDKSYQSGIIAIGCSAVSI